MPEVPSGCTGASPQPAADGAPYSALPPETGRPSGVGTWVAFLKRFQKPGINKAPGIAVSRVASLAPW